MAQLSPYTVECVLVMGCHDVERCRDVERTLQEAGFQSRSASEGRNICTRALVLEQGQGDAERMRDDVCSTVEAAVTARVGEWKAFVQVIGKQSAWAALEAGKPTLRGMTVLPRGTGLA